MKNVISVAWIVRAVGVAIGLSSAGQAHAQESAPPSPQEMGLGSGFEPGTDIATVPDTDMLGPQDLPGREKGDRTQTPEVAKPGPKEPAKETSWWERDRLTGDWWGVRTKLQDKGFTLNSSYTFNWSSVLAGGLKERGSSRSFFDLNIALDMDKVAGWSGATFYVDFSSTNDSLKMGDSGSFQGTNSLEMGRDLDEIGELWLEQKLFEDVVRVKLGKIDASSEFAFVNASGDFLVAGTAVMPNLLQFPTVPAQATGVVAFIYPMKKLYVAGGFFDGATLDGIRTGGRGPADFFSDKRSQSWYMITEVGYGWDVESMGSGRVAGGAWRHTGNFARFDGGTDSGTQGYYGVAEQQLWRRGATDELKDKGLYAFAQYAWADKQVSVIRNYIGSGMTFKGVCGERPDDSVGLYFQWSQAQNGLATGPASDEKGFETYYKAQITPWIYVQPDLQYIINPSGSTTVKNAWVGSIQVGITF